MYNYGTICSASLFHIICTIVSYIVQRDINSFTVDNISVIDSSTDTEKTHNTELTVLDQMNNQHESYSERAQVSTFISNK